MSHITFLAIRQILPTVSIRRNTILSFLIVSLSLLFPLAVPGQGGSGVIQGTVKDPTGAVLQGAKIAVQPFLQPVTTDGQGRFLLIDVPAGTYQVTISYVGFAPYSTSVTVFAGNTAKIDVNLKVASAADQVVVTAQRLFGDAEAINRVLAADNIVQVLPAEVITSLPNANIADALGRMPSVSVERDEGEAKYVQVRGTEPRLTNTTVDGVSIPSPESGVRQIKLDTIASDLVSSIEVNKTLQPNMDADGIGGSVNLVTKTAQDQPTVSLFGIGGYTPIANGRSAEQLASTIGRRFGAGKKFGILLAGSYDYNGRGINDTEPVPTPGDAVPHYDSQDLRNYVYDRTRWGLAGSMDYNLGGGSGIALRGLFSNFRNWGDDYIHTLNDGAFPSASHSRRRPNMAISSLALEGHHLFKSSELLWTGAVSRSRSAGGYGGADYSWVGDQNLNCHNDQTLATSVNRPGWAGCFGTGLDNVTDRNNYGFTRLNLPFNGRSAEFTLTGSVDYSMQFHPGNHFDSVAFGFKIRNSHKYDETYRAWWTTPTYSSTDANGNPVAEPVVNGQTLMLSDGDNIPIAVSAHSEWDSNFSNPGYYDGTYPAGNYADWAKVYEWVNQNQTQLVYHNDHNYNDPSYSLSANYDLIERIPAGYVMNTFDFTGRVRLLAGVRFEATHVSTLSFDSTVDPLPTSLTFKAGGDYLNVMPDASLRFAIDSSSDVRLVYSRGLSRPDPQDLSQSLSIGDLNQTPVPVGLGNPGLKAELANDVDLLYERTLPHVGLLEAGYFYKNLANPIATFQITAPSSDPRVPIEIQNQIKAQYPNGTTVQISQPINAGSAWVSGFEISFEQRLSYLPGLMGGAGISANYSYTGSRANNLPGRSDNPRLLRDAPNVWNLSPTYDTKRFSMRLGMTFNDAMIYAYQWQDDADSVGVYGPSGDNYLYPHYQFDTQASYKLPWGFSVVGYGLNLNNEVFGFYNGSPKYVVQREYYHPTYAVGLRWDLAPER